MSNMDENAQLRAQLEALGSARELLAAYAHEAWGAYMGYFLDKCIVQPDGYVRSLERLIATPYTKLTEAEKDSDRAEADKMIAIVTQARLAKEQR